MNLLHPVYMWRIINFVIQKLKQLNQTYQPKPTGQKKVFKYKRLEVFTKTHSYIPVSIFIVSGIFLLIYAFSKQLLTGPELLGSYFTGLFLFTFVEYMIHRYVFHMALTTTIRKNTQYLFHGIHHEYPKDKDRLAMPPLVSIILAIFVFGMVNLAIGKWSYGFVAGFLNGYALYLFVHYIVHAWKMPLNRFKTLWLYHNIHHYQNENVAYGVSSPFWDVVFNTLPEKTNKKTKK
jgi:sterol desaturase/sphingolipid hydroxylase (fatty acid hydroxylase superfamily)